MARISIFDSDPAGLACDAPEKEQTRAFQGWMKEELDEGAILVIPEIVDYEIRRSLILAGS